MTAGKRKWMGTSTITLRLDVSVEAVMPDRFGPDIAGDQVRAMIDRSDDVRQLAWLAEKVGASFSMTSATAKLTDGNPLLRCYTCSLHDPRGYLGVVFHAASPDTQRTRDIVKAMVPLLTTRVNALGRADGFEVTGHHFHGDGVTLHTSAPWNAATTRFFDDTVMAHAAELLAAPPPERPEDES